MSWRYNGAMPSVQVKNVPPDVHRVLRRRAVDAGQSLQEYLLARLVEDARRPTVDEVLARAAGRTGGRMTLADSAATLRAERDRR
jgi:hypothetical protein